MREVRSAVPVGERRRLADAVEARLFDLPEMAAAGAVMVFASFGSELPTAGIVRRLHQEGRRVLLPFLHEGSMEATELHPWTAMRPTTYGPEEPSEAIAADPHGIDVVVAPGLAFDEQGYRLGFGGGHYDRYLVRLRIGAALMGIGFDAQLVEEVPHLPEDVPLDVIVTDARTVRVRSESPGP